MRIALVTDGIWPHIIGGMQRHSYYLCKYFAKAGISVDLYYTLKNKTGKVDFADIFSPQELNFITPYLIKYPSGPYFPGHYLWKSYRYSKALYLELYRRGNCYDIIYIQGFSGWYLLNKKSKNEKLSTPTVLNLHGLEMFQLTASLKTKLEQFMFRPFARIQFASADYIQSLGGNLTSILLSMGIDRNRIVEWANGIEGGWVTTKLLEIKKPRKFGFIGRYERRKGIQELNSVLLKMIEERQTFEMHFIGPIPKEVQIKDSRIIYYGIVKEDGLLKEILDKIDWLVVPSYSEGMPTVIHEGMARGCAIIASDVGAVNAQVSDKNGCLIRPGDIPELFKAMTRAIQIEDSELLEKKQVSLIIVKQKYLWENIAEEMAFGFKQIAKTHACASVV